MAKKATSFDEICRNIRAKNFAPVYILMGEELFFIDKITELLIENVLNESERDFNQIVLYGADTDAGTIFNAARRFPMMSKYQLVVVREAQLLRDIEMLANYVKSPLKSTVLVINYKYKTLDGRKSLSANADKVGVVFDAKKIPDSRLPAFIESSLKERGLNADFKSVQLLSEFLGNDLNRLHKELDKLSIISDETGIKRITPEIIEQNIGFSKDYNKYELLKAIVMKDVLKANRIMQYIGRNPDISIQSALNVLFNYFSNLLICHYLTNKNQSSIMAALELQSDFQAKDYVTGLKNFPGIKVFKLIGEIRNADARSKGVNKVLLSEEDIMKELLYKILH
ncbi:MAG: DNA polymerase III subunit delta [Tannerellaceae bacterium]|jgi:DNA polymerase-3 subunit delta|nr:DNA polymerase III subunit delta [Tannerellaceae bacterium]